MKNIKMISLIILMLVISGCNITQNKSNVTSGNFFYLNPNKNLSTIGRVAIVELQNKSNYPQVSADMTDALYQAIQKRQIFGVMIVNQSDPAWQIIQSDIDTNVFQQLSLLRKQLKCEAVILGTVTEYRPYPHMMIGLRLKLLDLTDSQTIWAAEQVWDSSDKNLEPKIKEYFRKQRKGDLEPLGEDLVSLSSIEFLKFVAYEVASTLDKGTK